MVNGLRQGLGRKGLGQVGDTILRKGGFADCLIVVAGDENDRQRVAAVGQPFGQLDAGHSFQVDVENDAAVPRRRKPWAGEECLRRAVQLRFKAELFEQ